jgi:hypothetical protein
MDIVFLVLALIGALLLPRPRALAAAVGAWAVCLAFVGWGPAHNSGVHTGSAGFWAPWAIVLVLGLGLVSLTDLLRRRRATKRA